MSALAPLVVDLLRQLSATRGALYAAVALVAERDQEIRRLSASNRHYLAQLRAFASGRTIAEERQALDDELEPAGPARSAA